MSWPVWTPKPNKPVGAVYLWIPRTIVDGPESDVSSRTLHYDGGPRRKIYVFGGFVSRSDVAVWKPTDHASAYDPATDEWRDLTPRPTPRGGGWAVELNGRSMLLEAFRQMNGRTRPLRSCPVPRSWFSERWRNAISPSINGGAALLCRPPRSLACGGGKRKDLCHWQNSGPPKSQSPTIRM
jgi:hypothetical protein